jgi:hypothetical protein
MNYYAQWKTLYQQYREERGVSLSVSLANAEMNRYHQFVCRTTSSEAIILMDNKVVASANHGGGLMQVLTAWEEAWASISEPFPMKVIDGMLDLRY